MAERGRAPVRESRSRSPSPGRQPVHSVTARTAGLTATKKKRSNRCHGDCLRPCHPPAISSHRRRARFQQAEKKNAVVSKIWRRGTGTSRGGRRAFVSGRRGRGERRWSGGDDGSREHNQSQTLRRPVGSPRARLPAWSVPAPILKHVSHG